MVPPAAARAIEAAGIRRVHAGTQGGSSTWLPGMGRCGFEADDCGQVLPLSVGSVEAAVSQRAADIIVRPHPFLSDTLSLLSQL